MRRFFRPGLGLLLGGVVAHSAAAQRSPTTPVFALEEPRANPVFPAALVPFSISPEICRGGHIPRVSLRLYNVITERVATFRLRDRPAAVLDSMPLRCGQYVAQWDGTIANGAKAAPPGTYLMDLSVDGVSRKTNKFRLSEP